jgi:hypothetical protein
MDPDMTTSDDPDRPLDGAPNRLVQYRQIAAAAMTGAMVWLWQIALRRCFCVGTPSDRAEDRHPVHGGRTSPGATPKPCLTPAAGIRRMQA